MTVTLVMVNARISEKVNKFNKLFPREKNANTRYANNLTMNKLANENRPCWSCEMTPDSLRSVKDVKLITGINILDQENS